MLTMAVGQSDDVDPRRAIESAIEQCRTQLAGKSPRAGILFCALDSFDPDLIELVRVAFPGVDLMGSTSVAEMSSGHGLLEDSLELALFASDDVDIGVGIGTGVDVDVDAACRTAVAGALAGMSSSPRVCIVVAEALNAQRVSESLATNLPPDVLVLGGGAGRSDIRGGELTYQFCNDQVSEQGVALLVFGGDVAYSTAVATGWRVLGPLGIVSDAGYGMIKKIDGLPAAEFLRGYIDPHSGGTYGNPLAVRDAGRDDWYLRVVLGADDSGNLLISGGVQVGASVQLTTTNVEDMLEATAEAVERARDAFPGGATPSAALVFSCGVRKFMLGTRSGQEVASAARLLPGTPIAGMYCIGEIAPAGVSPDSQFLNETFVALLLGG